MYDLSSSAWDLGLVGLFQFVPALLVACLWLRLFTGLARRDQLRVAGARLVFT
jgi:hypothetical protein